MADANKAAALKQMRTVRTALVKVKREFRQRGFEPSWDLFSKTLAWFQLKARLSEQTQELVKKLWDTIP